MNNTLITKRIGAYVLDIFFIYILISMIASIKVLNPYYNKYMTYYKQYTEVANKYKEKEITEKELVKLNTDNIYYMEKYSVSTNIISVIVLVAYFVFFQKYNNGQTLGKKIMKIKVIDNKQNSPSIWKYLLRLIIKYYLLVGNILAIIINGIIVFTMNSKNYVIAETIVTYLFLGLGIISFIMMLINKEHNSLHDRITNTKVVDE